MKRLVAILLSGLLVCAWSFLGGTGTAEGNAPGPATTSDTPTVTGDLLNSPFFAHGAYVMQGVSDPAKVFALPLLGVPELNFLPTVSGTDPSTVTWRLDVSDPEGISAEIRDSVLYVWGNNPSWSGYGTVTLSGATANAQTGSVTIPVTVFRSDKTLINSEGKKDYFVPWSPQLDINSILSVEEHMRKYNKPDIGLLDRTVRFSHWRLMEYRKDVDLSTMWLNASVTDRQWPMQSQLALVDVCLAELSRLGVNGVRMQNEYYISSEHGTTILPLYGNRNCAGPTKTPEEEAYVICEAHRLGMSVMTGNMVSIGDGVKWRELFWASPEPLSAFLTNFGELNRASLTRWTQLGVDIVDVCPAVSSLNQNSGTMAQATELSNGIVHIAEAARALYPGPLFHTTCLQVDFFPGESVLEAPFWPSLDILGLSDWNIRLTTSPAPTMAMSVNVVYRHRCIFGLADQATSCSTSRSPSFTTG